jgi:hypothetical protein
LFCTDGVCCDTACDQALEACDLPGREGTCSPEGAAVPAASHTGLFLLAGALAAFGIFALVRRRELKRYFLSFL